MGKDLLDKVVTAAGQTDLPKELVAKELHALLETAQIPVSELNLDTLRKLMASYLQDVFVEAKKEFAIGE